MSGHLVSELTVKELRRAEELATEDMEALLTQPFLEGIVKGEDRSGWIGIIHVGLWPTSDGYEKRYIIHTSLEGRGHKTRNVEDDKIKGFFMAKRVMRAMLDDSRSVYTPAIKGHKIVHEDNDREVLIRDIYVNYEPRILAYNEEEITPKDYAYLLGKELTRFMLVGMTNAPRHIRPNFSRPSVRTTCMIDLDKFDPRTFYWNAVDRFPKESLNYYVLIKHETIFLHDVGLYFLENHLPKELDNFNNIVRELKNTYFDGFADEIKRIKGNKIGEQIISQFCL